MLVAREATKSVKFYMMHWDSRVAERSPAFGVLDDVAATLVSSENWPDLAQLDGLVAARGVSTSNGRPLRVVASAPRGQAALSYEARVHCESELEVRERDWHDLFNVLAWATYPCTKASLNARHNIEAARERNGRSPPRDALTLFDESGMIVLAHDAALLEDVRCFRWRRLFRDKREQARSAMCFLTFGHALFHKALEPYVGMTAHAILLSAPREVIDAPRAVQVRWADAEVAARVADPASLSSPRELAPLPVLGVPGWWPDNEDPSFYDNRNYFRPGRQRSAA